MATNNYEQNTITMLKNIAREREVYVDTLGLKNLSELENSENRQHLETILEPS